MTGYITFNEEFIPKEWKQLTLGELLKSICGGGTPSTKNSEYWDGNIPWTTTATFYEGDIILTGFQRNITEKGLKESSSQLAPKGSVLLGTRVGVGKAVVATFDVAINQDITALVTSECCIPEYLALALKAPGVRRWFDNNKRGTTIKGIPRKDLVKLVIPLPSLPEQKEISRTLLQVNKAKEATGNVIAAARQLKASLIKHLFTYGPVPLDQAEKVPLKETEIGSIPEHWELKKCQELCDKISVGIVVKPASYYVNEGIPAFRSLNVKEDRLSLGNLVYISEESNNGPLAKSKLQSGDVLIVRTGYPGTSCVVPENFAGANCIDLVFARVNKAMIIGDYLSRFFNSPAGRKQALKSKTGLAQQHLNVSSVNKTVIPVPPKNEQDRIVKMLEDVDKKIEIEEKKKLALSTFFTSLLHHLMTGKVRVKDFGRESNAKENETTCHNTDSSEGH